MTIPAEAIESLSGWLGSNGLKLLVVTLLLLAVYRWSRPVLHRLMVRVFEAGNPRIGEAPDGERVRRLATIEDLLDKVLKFVLVAVLAGVVLSVLDLWGLVAGLGLVLAAITLAGQSIVLDYLMGALILLEGQYYKGDAITVGAVEGVVEELGLRRTVIRDRRGTLHSVSNGLIRSSANKTRSYATATIDIDGIADRDVEAMITILDEVGAAIASDDAKADRLLGTPGYAGTINLSSSGATLRLSGRVRPEAVVEVEDEMRRRVAAAMAAQGIQPIRPAPWAPADEARMP